MNRPAASSIFALACALAAWPAAARDDAVWAAAQAQKAPFMESVKRLVEIESGSRDAEGLERMAETAGAALMRAGAQVERLDARMVKGTLTGKGNRTILLLAHMDTVYERGMLAKQPFRIDGDRAYGLAISDDKQAVALIVHVLEMLRALQFDGYGRITVLFNADEEVSSLASRALITRLGAEHDVTLSFEAATDGAEEVSLITSGIARAILKVHGESAHPANFDKLGANALVEMTHQIGQMLDLPDHPSGLRFNWTVAHAGTVDNKIPDEAEAHGDIRVVDPAQLDALEAKMRKRMANQQVPGTKVELQIERGRPPLRATPENRALALHIKSISDEIGRPLVVHDTRPRGGTDAGYASMQSRGAVLEHLGVAGRNAHSSRGEYIVISSIEPRLYIVARTIIDISQDKVH